MRKFTLKSLLAITMLFMAFFAFAQNGPHALPGPNQGVCFMKDYIAPASENTDALFTEDFTGGCPPAGWAVVGLGQTNWQGSATNNAGGTSPEGMLNWQPQFVGVSRLVSPAINTTGYDALGFEFKHYVNDYGGGYDLKVETTSDGTTWNEVWSIAVNGSVGPETKLILIDNGDVGSANFKVAFTLSGDSYQLNYWYLDDISLFQAANLDAAVAAVYISAIIPTGNTVTPKALVTNLGTQTTSFTATFKMLQGGTAIYTQNYNVTNLPGFQSQLVSFPNWTAVQGNYTAEVTVTLAGDENPANNILTKDFQVLDNLVIKKPLYEEFTSSTCAPCAAANPIIDGVLNANPGEYSLIKYQMDWPGSGDIYYTEQGGDRKDYYGCSWVPDLYINATQIDPAGSLTQTMFDEFAENVTAIALTADASIDENMMITVNLNISSAAAYAAGLKAHIVVVEKVTVGNVSSNGETEFHNVMMTMLPGSSGTTLGALSVGSSFDITETFDMTTTNMEEPTDLSVIVFVQDDTDKSMIQSEMIEVEAANFDTYAVNFNVTDSDGAPVEGATITMDGQGAITTNAAGQASYPEIFPGVYAYDITKAGLEGVSGTLEVIDQNVNINATLNIPEYYYYEDFEAGLPTDYTAIASGWNYVYWYGGKVIFFRQDAGTADVMLVTPEFDLSLVDMLYFTVGEANQNPTLSVGTVSDPANPGSFIELDNFAVTADWQELSIKLSDYSISDSYLAFKYSSETTGFFSLDLVKMTAAGGSGGSSIIIETFDYYTAGQKLVQQAIAQGKDYWTTWSNSPGSAEDPMVSDAISHTGMNSMLIEGTNDAVLLLGDKTEGKYSLSFYVNIPTGFFGYFNILQDFAGASSAWGTQAYFDAGGLGTIDAGGEGAGTFTYAYDTWIPIEVVVDLDEDWAEFYVNDVNIIEWQWSLGTFGTPGLLQLSAANFYAWNVNGTPKAYFDDIDYKAFSNDLVFEPFEDYIAGEQLVEQAVNMGLTYWTTWSNTPGSAEDPVISTEQAYEGSNSVLCQGTNDFVMLFGDQTAGSYAVNFYMYIPSGKVGYYNILQAFSGGTSKWGSEVYLNPNGIAELTAGGTAGVASFNYNYDEWFFVENIIDLDNDWAQLIVNGTLVHSWQWSIGASGGGINQLGAMDIYAATTNGTPYFFMDNIQLTPASTVGIGEIAPNAVVAKMFPNPAKDMLNITSPAILKQIRIMNYLGQVVLNSDASGNSFATNVSELQSGLYIVEITTADGKATQKLIIE